MSVQAAGPTFAQGLAGAEARLVTHTETGLRAVIAPRAGTGRAFVGIYIFQGRIGEGREGIAHLAEHIVANSRRMAPNPHTAGENYAGNAYTRPNYTSFWAVTNPAGVNFLVHSRLGCTAEPRYRSDVFGAQHIRVLSEFDYTRSSGHDHAALIALERLFFGGDPSLETEIANTEAMTLTDVRTFVSRHYLTDRAIMAVVGDIDAAAVEAAFTASADLMPTRRGPPALLSLSTERRRSAVLRRSYFARPVAGLGFIAPGGASPDFAAFQVLDQLLLGGRERLEPQEWGFTASRSINSPLGQRLGRRATLAALTDARNYGHEAPPILEGATPVYPIVATFEQPIEARRAERLMLEALRECREEALSDAAVTQASAALVSFHDQWLAEPFGRVLADNLAACAAFGGDVTRVGRLRDEYAGVTAEQVRAAMDRHILGASRRFILLTSA